MASAAAPPTISTIPIPADEDRAIWGPRSRKQLGRWAAGGAFMLFSAAITRRAIARRNVWTRPLFFHTNMEPHLPPLNAPLEAVEALSVATINAVSFTIMLTGGALWAFDVSSIAELRRRTRDKLGYEKAIEAERKEAGGVTQEEWMYQVLVDEDEKKNSALPKK